MKLIQTADLGREVAQRAADLMAPALRENRKVSIALSGGRTPLSYLPVLFAQPLDWRRVVLTLADDRLVPLDHPDSNAGLVMKQQANTPAAAARFVPLTAQFDNIEAAVEESAPRIAREVPWPLDLLILGIGEDGHIASLFPQLDPDLEAEGLCLGVPSPPAPHCHPRVSLTFSTLASARAILVALQGKQKHAALERALKMPQSPIGALAQRVGTRARAILAP